METQKHDNHKVPIPRAFLDHGKIRRDADAIARDLRAHMRDRRDDRAATSRARVVIVHTSSMRFGFFRLLRY
jgi:hypothetical protein